MKATFSTLAVATSLFVGLVPLASVSAHAADAAVAVSKSDAEISTAVEAALAAEPTLKGQKITVTTKGEKDKEVTLTGTVTEPMLMVTAAQIAEKVHGVKYVINDIYPEAYLREHAGAKK